MNEEEFCHWALSRLRLEYERQAAPYLERLARIKATAVPSRFIPVCPMGETDAEARCRQGHTLTCIYHMPTDSFTVGCNTCGEFGLGVKVGPMGKQMAELQALRSYLDQAGCSGATAPASQVENPAPQAGHLSTPSGSGCGSTESRDRSADPAGAA